MEIGSYKNIRQQVFLLITTGDKENEQIKEQILATDAHVQNKLLLGNTCAGWSYLVLTFFIIRIYKSLQGNHYLLLGFLLLAVVAAMSIWFFSIWKSMCYQPMPFKKASKTYLNYHIYKLSGQCKLIIVNLLILTAILAVSGIFFLIDIHFGGFVYLFKIIMPFGILSYGMGIYFMWSFSRQKKQLRQLDLQIDKASFLENFSEN